MRGSSWKMQQTGDSLTHEEEQRDFFFCHEIHKQLWRNISTLFYSVGKGVLAYAMQSRKNMHTKQLQYSSTQVVLVPPSRRVVHACSFIRKKAPSMSKLFSSLVCTYYVRTYESIVSAFAEKCSWFACLR